MSQTSAKDHEIEPIRVLHVLGGMNRGGIETWLMHILRSINRDRIQMDFLVHTNDPCAYDSEIRSLGSQIIPCLNPTQPQLYAANFKRILKQYGPYQIVHSHVHFFSGFVLRIAHKAGVPICIAHSHNDTSSVEAKKKWTRKVYIAIMRYWLFQYATVGLAASKIAASDLFGIHWENDLRWKILYYGIDLAPFQNSIEPDKIREKISIPDNVFVIGHVGRFVEQKNHFFLLQIAKALIHKEPKVYFLLVGEGALRKEVEYQAVEVGISRHICFMDGRDDVPMLMKGAMDMFLFPSLYEGLGLVLVEAQAAGLPCIFSDVVPSEADIVEPLVKRLSLSISAEVWAEEILKLLKQGISLNKIDALQEVKQSLFNITSSIKALTEIYEHSIKNK